MKTVEEIKEKIEALNKQLNNFNRKATKTETDRLAISHIQGELYRLEWVMM